MARSLWTGAVTVGLVNVPVRLYATTRLKEDLPQLASNAVHLEAQVAMTAPCGVLVDDESRAHSIGRATASARLGEAIEPPPLLVIAQPHGERDASAHALPEAIQRPISSSTEAAMANALDYLTDQHQQVRDLFEEIERADEGEAFGFLETLADVLASHAAIEEQIFYPGVKRPETEENLADSVQEHDEMKRQLADLLALDNEAEDYRPYVGRLKELVMHHVEDEENKLFPKVSGLMNEQDLETMGNELERLYDKIQSEEIPSEKIEGPHPEL